MAKDGPDIFIMLPRNTQERGHGVSVNVSRPPRLEQVELTQIARPELREAVAHAVLAETDLEQQPLTWVAFGAMRHEFANAQFQQRGMERYLVGPGAELRTLRSPVRQLPRLDDEVRDVVVQSKIAG